VERADDKAEASQLRHPSDFHVTSSIPITNRMMSAMSVRPTDKKIAYLTKIFPKISETFILQEVLDLEALGVNLAIFTLQRPTDNITHSLAGQIRASVTCLPDSLWGVRQSPLWAHTRLALTSPRRYLSTIRFWLQSTERPSLSKVLQAGSLATALQDGQIDHLHVHFANAPTSVAELTHRFSGIPYSMTCHAKDIFLAEPATLRRKMRHAEFVITCTEDNRQHLQQLSDNGTPIHCFYHGVNLARFDRMRPAPNMERSTISTIISVGRFREKKGFLTLIRACHLLAVRGHHFRCRIVGFGPLQSDMEALIRELHLEQTVTLLGQKPLEDVVGLYQEADIFTLPCQVAQDGDRDGIPNVLMEALACRLPVVTTAISGIPELIQHHHNGILVPPQDSEALALALAHLLDNPALRRRLGQSGRQTIEQRFSSEQTGHRLKTLFLKEPPPAEARICAEESEPPCCSQQGNVPLRVDNHTTDGRIGYILKGFPRRSEAFITNEITLMEQMGLQLHLFSAFQGETTDAAPPTEARVSPLTYLPEHSERTDSGFAGWLAANLPRYLPSQVRLMRTVPRQYLRAAYEAWTLSWRCRSTSFSWPKKVFYKDFLRAGFIAQQVIETGHFRHLHAHFCHGATTMAMFASMLTELPFSFTAHAKDIYLPKLNPGDLLQIKLRRAKFVVTCTGANHDYLKEVCPHGAPIHTIYHGVNTAHFAPVAHRQSPAIPTILSVGRFVEKKGFPFLIEACRILKEQGVPFHCRIVGEPDEQTELVQALISRYGLEHNVSIEPGVAQQALRAIYNSATLFVLPCHIVDNGDRDGIPNVLAEAMASGIPVISTAVSGIPELIEHRQSGLLVPQRDPQSLAKAIEELLRDPQLRHHLAEEGRAAIQRIFDSSRTTKRLFDLFQADAIGIAAPRQETHAPCR
jgi:glycosyltransferase involved in cell wall biosynthesis